MLCVRLNSESSSQDTKLAAAVIREGCEYIPDSAREAAARSCTAESGSLRNRSSRRGIVSSVPNQRQPIHSRSPYVDLRIRQMRADRLRGVHRIDPRFPSAPSIQGAHTRELGLSAACSTAFRSGVVHGHAVSAALPASPPRGHADQAGSARPPIDCSISRAVGFPVQFPEICRDPQSAAATASPGDHLLQQLLGFRLPRRIERRTRITRLGPRRDLLRGRLPPRNLQSEYREPGRRPSQSPQTAIAAFTAAGEAGATGTRTGLKRMMAEVAGRSVVEAFSISASVRITSSSAGLRSSPDECQLQAATRSKPMQQSVGQPWAVTNYGVRTGSYAECRKGAGALSAGASAEAGRRPGPRPLVVLQVHDLAQHAAEASGPAGRKRSVSTAYTTRPKAVHL